MVAGRREDRLVFDLQNAVAESFYGRWPPDGRSCSAERAADEALLLGGQGGAQLNQILLLNIEERLNPAASEARPINERFSDRGRHARGRPRRPVPEDPRAILETFLLYQATPGIKGLSARTLRALYNARKVMDANFRNDPRNHATFRAMLMQPRGRRTPSG